MSSSNDRVFVENASEVAKAIMAEIDANYMERFSTIIRFLVLNPEMAPDFSQRKKPLQFGQVDYIRACAEKFVRGRTPKTPKKSKTVPDEMVGVVLQVAFDVKKEDLAAIETGHRDSMTAENLVGHLLERYIAEILETQKWVWVSGALIKAVDFINPPTDEDPLWHALQIKNRDNSENSSSQAIRNGTDIEEWHRTFSMKKGSNWESFPDTYAKGNFSEEGFRRFVVSHLRSLKEQ